MASPQVAIIGGGISGLAAAHELTQRGVPFVLLERAPRCGGVIRTDRVDGYTIDAGPDAILTQKPAATALCRELGLGARLRPQLHRQTFIVRDRRLRPLPEASVFGIPTRWAPFVGSDVFTWHGKLRMAAEMFLPGRPAADESIGAFIGRRFGREAVEYLAEPLLAGIHGGDASRLSMRAAFPKLLDLEAAHRSVILGFRRATAGRAPTATAAPSPFVALPSGMAELSETIVKSLPSRALRTGIGVEALSEVERGYLLRLSDGERIIVPAVILATPPSVSARLTRSVDAELAALCGSITAASVVTIALGYPRSAVGRRLNGTGFVVPRREGLSIRAVSWVSSKWADRAPDDRVLLRAYLGGVTDPNAIDLSDTSLIAASHRDLASMLDIHGEPELTRVYRWPGATPQLEVGHTALIDRIEARLASHSGLFLSAGGIRGTGIADCVADARCQARRAAGDLAPALTA